MKRARPADTQALIAEMREALIAVDKWIGRYHGPCDFQPYLKVRAALDHAGFHINEHGEAIAHAITATPRAVRL